MVTHIGFEPMYPRAKVVCVKPSSPMGVIGRSSKTRTCGLMVPNHPLYQTELYPEIFISS